MALSASSDNAPLDGPPVDPDLLDATVALVKAAGARTLGYYRSDDLAIDRKGDGTPVTEADKDAETFLRGEIGRRFPDDAIVGEEEGTTPGSSGRRWIIDPIDGTKAFMRGVPLYSNLLAFDDEHGPAVGVINFPALGETVYAGRGLGCFQDHARGTRVRAHVGGAVEEGKRFLLSSGFTNWDDNALLAVKHAGWALRTWGDAYGYALVATGRAQAMVDPVAMLWDLAPMAVIMPEAGGRLTSIDGLAGPDHGSGVATNGADHDELLGLLRA
jgi:histidinol-phosphatase